MKILLTCDAVGGVWTYTLDLIRALPQHQFAVATMGPFPSDAQQAAFAELPNATLYPSEWKLEWMDSPWDDVARAGDWLLDLERQFVPDLIHLNGFVHGAWPFRARKLVVGHSCVLSWWRAVKGENAPPAWDTYGHKVRKGLRGADSVVAPTQAMLDEFRSIYGDFGPARAIWNGSPLPEAPVNEPSSLPFVLCAGRLWDEAKNVALLDRVASLLDAPIRVAGATGQGQFVAHHLDTLGYLTTEDLHRQMEDAAIWVHPARYEAFGLGVLEAAYRRCALVLSDIPTLRELWDGAALFVAPDDVAGWGSALQSLLDDRDLCGKWVGRAQERARRYSLERFGAEYARLYDEIER